MTKIGKKMSHSRVFGNNSGQAEHGSGVFS